MSDILTIPALNDADDDRCMMDPTKKCDNCFKCIDAGLQDYVDLPIDKVVLSDEDSIIVDPNRGKTLLVSTLYGIHFVRRK